MDPEPFWKDIAAWIGAAGVAFFAWLARWAWGKLDSKADRAELAELVRRLDKRDEEARASRLAIHAKIDAAKEQVHALAVSLGAESAARKERERLEGQKGG